MRADEANERNHTWSWKTSCKMSLLVLLYFHPSKHLNVGVSEHFLPTRSVCSRCLLPGFVRTWPTSYLFSLFFFHLPSLFPGLPSVGNLGLGTFLRAIPVTAALGKFLSRIFPLLPPGVAFPSGNNKRETFWCSKSSAAREWSAYHNITLYRNNEFQHDQLQYQTTLRKSMGNSVE